jgi:copper chaperone NosL
MRSITQLILSAIVFIAISCSPESEPIRYGFDGCAHCQMTIFDARYGAEIVTHKSKVFKFDSIECMAEFSQVLDQGQIAMMLVTDFENPGELINIETVSFLHSEGLPSPMGMYLTAFGNIASAEVFQAERGGEIIDMKRIFQLVNEK